MSEKKIISKNGPSNPSLLFKANQREQLGGLSAILKMMEADGTSLKIFGRFAKLLNAQQNEENTFNDINSVKIEIGEPITYEEFLTFLQEEIDKLVALKAMFTYLKDTVTPEFLSYIDSWVGKQANSGGQSWLQY